LSNRTGGAAVAAADGRVAGHIRTNTDIVSAPFLAASIFLDILNVFSFFLKIFSSHQEG
jgi:hypothetical protein